jgi:hypothetical protein
MLDYPCQLSIIRNWYKKLTVNARWGNCLSYIFAVLNGNVISPTLFNVFINMFIAQPRKGNLGCVVRSLYIDH